MGHDPTHVCGCAASAINAAVLGASTGCRMPDTMPPNCHARPVHHTRACTRAMASTCERIIAMLTPRWWACTIPLHAHGCVRHAHATSASCPPQFAALHDCKAQTHAATLGRPPSIMCPRSIASHYASFSQDVATGPISVLLLLPEPNRAASLRFWAGGWVGGRVQHWRCNHRHANDELRAVTCTLM
jgi:hypothetical protein